MCLVWLNHQLTRIFQLIHCLTPSINIWPRPQLIFTSSQLMPIMVNLEIMLIIIISQGSHILTNQIPVLLSTAMDIVPPFSLSNKVFSTCFSTVRAAFKVIHSFMVISTHLRFHNQL